MRYPDTEYESMRPPTWLQRRLFRSFTSDSYQPPSEPLHKSHIMSENPSMSAYSMPSLHSHSIFRIHHRIQEECDKGTSRQVRRRSG